MCLCLIQHVIVTFLGGNTMRKFYILVMVCALFITGCTQGTKDNTNNGVDDTTVTNPTEPEKDKEPVEPVASLVVS